MHRLTHIHTHTHTYIQTHTVPHKETHTYTNARETSLNTPTKQGCWTRLTEGDVFSRCHTPNTAHTTHTNNTHNTHNIHNTRNSHNTHITHNTRNTHSTHNTRNTPNTPNTRNTRNTHTHNTTHTHKRETFSSHLELSSATATLTPLPVRCRSVFSSMRTTSQSQKGLQASKAELSREQTPLHLQPNIPSCGPNGKQSDTSPTSHLAAPTASNQTRRTLKKAQHSYHPSHGAILVCTGASLSCAGASPLVTIRSTQSLCCRLDPVPRRAGLCQQTK
jgi:hypothetical protein